MIIHRYTLKSQVNRFLKTRRDRVNHHKRMREGFAYITGHILGTLLMPTSSVPLEPQEKAKTLFGRYLNQIKTDWYAAGVVNP